ncbi:MAG: hypothetical protein GW839_13720 [Flavobacteriales bacterium]|nr:hypothetical protein [Flavobacteriia bacterium]NCP04870.1 hypothetical protein [Flavobacteriales bacterium]PIV93981.1 MAG: hypothetical protein COW44_06620 [Flavobacteriaceae bacterium CG17_big_fil_post_rev_8_21_14_2_50_33_15]PIY11035.1 MAG: hypothetical protein COZ17_08065 [Flavobacteriaceae bacterium CG_4_10_14_3_um_filter_33_47]PJB19372.1 MAG: hypothetical protein CO117_04975 [Flavobacteriaceae bacterium CG_4_9_14_3_um_filter_33_16]
MQKLSKEDIAFIDTYLKNSDIVFSDIRIEMVDHVASEIESIINEGDNRDFYYIFKDYMVKNKVDLLKDNHKYYKACDKKILRALVKNVFSIKAVFILITTFLSLFFLNKFLELNLFFQVLRALPFVVFLLFAGVYRFIGRNKNMRFSSIERIAIYFILIGQIINLYFQGLIFRKMVLSEQSLQITIVTSFLIFSLVLLMQVFFQFKKEYHLKYKSVL